MPSRNLFKCPTILKTKREIETLLAGGEIIKEIHQELIYPEMYQSLENVWSLLFMTGYFNAAWKWKG